MANPEITNNDTLALEVFNPAYKDATLGFTGVATWDLGVIMARKAVSAGAVTPDVGNTGDGTVTALALAPGGPPLPGAWNLECTVAVTNGGIFKLVDPNGAIVADNINMVVGAGAATPFVGAGLSFIITDGATDFIVGDKFALAVTDEEGDWSPYVEGGLDGTGVAKGVLPETITSTGAGDVLRRMLISGEVAEAKLSVQAGGTIPAQAIEDLRDFTILSITGVRTDILDNQ